MSWTVTPAERTPVDKQGIGSVSLLLHGNGTNGSTTITDSSPSTKTVTVVGNAQISTAQSKFGGSSIAFDGSGDAARVSSNADFQYGTSDFTWEMWIYANTWEPEPYLLDHGLANGGLIQYLGGIMRYFNTTTGIASTLYTDGFASGVATGTWHHIAVSRSSGTTKLFFNGVNTRTATDAHNYPQQNVVVGNGFFNNAPGLNGYIDDLRITKGVARYTANFTPPTAAFPDI